jgi:hypothetical protein
VGEVVVDTNVWAVADEQHGAVSLECVETCQAFLRSLGRETILAVDDRNAITEEYRRNLRRDGWAWKLLSVLQQRGLVVCVALAGTEDHAVFAVGGALASLHDDDRVFVLVSLEATPPRPIVNAVDQGWSRHAAALRQIGVALDELCPCDLDRFAR